MSSNQKFIISFLGSGTALFLIFYFLPIEIFEIQLESKYAASEQYVTIQQFFGMDPEFNQMLFDNNLSMRRVAGGYLIAFILYIGLPLMFAYRLMLNRAKKDSES